MEALGPMPEHPTTKANAQPVSNEAVEAHLERLQDDLARLKKQIRHSQRLAALGTTAAMLAHEINNLMTPVMGYAKFALDENDPELMTKALRITLKQIDSVMTMPNGSWGWPSMNRLCSNPRRWRG